MYTNFCTADWVCHLADPFIQSDLKETNYIDSHLRANQDWTSFSRAQLWQQPFGDSPINESLTPGIEPMLFALLAQSFNHWVTIKRGIRELKSTYKHARIIKNKHIWVKPVYTLNWHLVL